MSFCPACFSELRQREAISSGSKQISHHMTNLPAEHGNDHNLMICFCSGLGLKFQKSWGISDIHCGYGKSLWQWDSHYCTLVLSLRSFSRLLGSCTPTER